MLTAAIILTLVYLFRKWFFKKKPEAEKMILTGAAGITRLPPPDPFRRPKVANCKKIWRNWRK